MKAILKSIYPLINGKGGAQIRVVIAAPVGALLSWLASLVMAKTGYGISEVQLAAATVAVSGAIYHALDTWVQFYTAGQIEKVQESLNEALPASQQIKVDGYLGPKTEKAAEKVVVQAVAVPE